MVKMLKAASASVRAINERAVNVRAVKVRAVNEPDILFVSPEFRILSRLSLGAKPNICQLLAKLIRWRRLTASAFP
jgi:hypothetical protein